MVRGLTFDADDANSSPDRQTVRMSEAADGSAAAAPTPPRFLRSVSFLAHPQVLEPKAGSQQERAHERQDGERQAPFDGPNLPDGIQAIPVADPDDPNAIVMQVSAIHTYVILARTLANTSAVLLFISSLDSRQCSCLQRFFFCTATFPACMHAKLRCLEILHGKLSPSTTPQPQNIKYAFLSC